jgi:tripartite-type tricarboxylate transporter receptor subunit TctC
LAATFRRLAPAVIGAALLAPGALPAQGYPLKPVRILTTVTGGSLDLTARFIAPKLGESLGQPVIVDNRGGVLSMELVSRAPPDGYTLLLASASLWISQYLRTNVAWDPVKDFMPVTTAVTLPNVIAVHPSLPVKSVRDLIALARARPGQLNYSSGQVGSSSHLAGEYFNMVARTRVVRVPYKGAGPAMIALLTGEAHVSFPNTASALPYVAQNKLKALAVATAQPSSLVPDLPTAAASGLPGYESKAVLAIFAPAKTPDAIIQRLNHEIGRALNDPEVKRRMFDSGAEVAAGTPAELAETMRADMALTGKLIAAAGIRAE